MQASLASLKKPGRHSHPATHSVPLIQIYFVYEMSQRSGGQGMQSKWCSLTPHFGGGLTEKIFFYGFRLLRFLWLWYITQAFLLGAKSIAQHYLVTYLFNLPPNVLSTLFYSTLLIYFILTALFLRNTNVIVIPIVPRLAHTLWSIGIVCETLSVLPNVSAFLEETRWRAGAVHFVWPPAFYWR